MQKNPYETNLGRNTPNEITSNDQKNFVIFDKVSSQKLYPTKKKKKKKEKRIMKLQL